MLIHNHSDTKVCYLLVTYHKYMFLCTKMLEYTVPYQQSSGQDVLRHMTLQMVLVWVGCYLIQCTLPPGAHKHQLVMSYLHQMIRCKRLVCVHMHTCVHDRSTGSNIYRHIPTQNTHMHTDMYTYTHTHTHTCAHTHVHTYTHYMIHTYVYGPRKHYFL